MCVPEFEIWYKKSFLVPEEELDVTMKKSLRQVSKKPSHKKKKKEQVQLYIFFLVPLSCRRWRGSYYNLTCVGGAVTNLW